MDLIEKWTHRNHIFNLNIMNNLEYTVITNKTNNFSESYKDGNDTDWGPKRDSLSVVIPITILYMIIFITGVVGNISTCIVISRNKSMHTATNYYLFSLAISDLLLLVSGLPPEVYAIWSKYPYIFGEAFCVMQGFAAETSANATVLTITAFTVERYVAICHPFLSHTMSKLSRAIKFIISVWLLALCLAIPQAMSFGIIYKKTNETYCVCAVKRIVIPHAFEISTCLFFVAPMSMITILYILIGLQLHRSTVGPSRGNSVKLKHRVYKPAVAYTSSSTQAALIVNGQTSENIQLSRQDDEGRKNFARNAQATKHVVKMLVAVVVAFFICWAPFHAQRLLAIYGKSNSPHMVTAFGILTYVSGVLYYLSTSINPFLYHIMSNKFREAFKDTFKGLFGRRNSSGKRCYATLSARSSQVNSHSNTDSCSRQNSLRYLEAEMARLHDSKRPLVVSFRRKKSQYPKRPKHVTILDAELQEALDKLNEEPKHRELFEKMRPYNKNKYKINNDKANTKHFSFVEVHNLEPKHICSKNTIIKSTKLDDMYQEPLILNDDTHRNNSTSDSEKSFHVTWKSIHARNITKSFTMPFITKEQSSELTQETSISLNNDKIVNVNEKSEKSNSCSHLECFHTEIVADINSRNGTIAKLE